MILTVWTFSIATDALMVSCCSEGRRLNNYNPIFLMFSAGMTHHDRLSVDQMTDLETTFSRWLRLRSAPL